MRLRFPILALADLAKNPNTIFYASLVAFFIDNGVNYFVNVPVFVIFMLFILPLMWLNLMNSGKFPRFLMVFTAVLLTAFFISNLIYGFKKSNISDLTFILLFATSFYYYSIHKAQLTVYPVKVFLFSVLSMFGVGLLGFHSTSIDTRRGDYLDLELAGVSFDSLKAQAIPFDEFAANFDEGVNVDSLLRTRLKKYFPNRQEIDTMQMFGIRLQPVINFAGKEKAGTKDKRMYRTGLFRIPHVAAYFFGALMFFYFYSYRQERRLIYLPMVLLMGFLMLWIGVRTYFIAIILSVAIFLVVRKSLWYLVLFLAVFLLMVVFRYQIFLESQNTLLEPFAMLLISAVDAPEQLSRVVLVQSWWMEVQQFGILDFLTGKTLYQSQLANLENLFNPVWYHNDFLSVFYAYGFPALILFVLLYIQIYRFGNKAGQNKTLVTIFFFTFLAAAFINGFYYYFPIFLLYIFVLMTQNFNKAS